MKTWKKVLIGVVGVSAALIVLGIAVHESNKGVVTVQTGKAERQDLSSIVSASGEIKPKTYVNIGANAFG
jgi:HlyD family secretion protein